MANLDKIIESVNFFLFICYAFMFIVGIMGGSQFLATIAGAMLLLTYVTLTYSKISERLKAIEKAVTK